MTRVFEALERARSMAWQPDLRVDAGTPSPLRCPGCRAPYVGSVPGPWKARFLKVFRIQPHKCGLCGHRFGSENAFVDPSLADRGREQLFSVFLPPVDERTFDDLIVEIARDEEQLSEEQRRRKQRPRPAAEHLTK